MSRAFLIFTFVIVFVIYAFLIHRYAYITWEKIVKYFSTFRKGKEEEDVNKHATNN